MSLAVVVFSEKAVRLTKTLTPPSVATGKGLKCN
jgi:hypothetical protein